MQNQDVVRSNENEPERTRAAREVMPLVDIFENETELLLVADLPGVEPDGLNVQLDPPELKIEGRAMRSEHEEQPTYYVRKFQVSESIDPEAISAELNQGVLQVHLPKNSAQRPRRVEVRAG
jgi:HSP20 family molecular chaperone IbpA